MEKKEAEDLENEMENVESIDEENEAGGIKIEDGNALPADADENIKYASDDKQTTDEAKDDSEEEQEDAYSDKSDVNDDIEDSGLEDESSEDEDGEPKERKMNWAKKNKGSKKEAAKDKTASELEEANDKYARLFAEFDNFRKRSEKEKAERYDLGAKDVIEKILPVLDNFERGFDSVEESDKDDAFVTGMDLVYKQFLTVLEDMGVKPIEAVGCEFNPDFHNAVMHVDDEEAGENIIVEEFQKGYTYKDQVVRYSMVKVAN